MAEHAKHPDSHDPVDGSRLEYPVAAPLLVRPRLPLNVDQIGYEPQAEKDERWQPGKEDLGDRHSAGWTRPIPQAPRGGDQSAREARLARLVEGRLVHDHKGVAQPEGKDERDGRPYYQTE